MNCLSCGAALTPGTRFCELCGTGVAETPPGANPGPGTPAAPTVANPGNGWTPQSAGQPQIPTRPQAGSTQGQYPTGPGAAHQYGAGQGVPTAPQPSGGAYPGYQTAAYPPAAAPAAFDPAGAPPAKGHGGVWFAVGGGVAAAVVAAILGIVLLGGGKSNTTQTATEEPTNQAAPMADNSQSATQPTTVTAEATMLDGAWPTAASWATSTCKAKSYTAALSLETDASKVAICEGAKGSFYYQGIRKSDNAVSDWLPATYRPDQNQFVAVDNSGDPATTYTVTPTSLRITTGSTLESFEFSKGSQARGTRSEDDLLRELVSLLEASSQYKALLGSYTDNTFAGSGCLSASDATDKIERIRDNRAAMADAGARLSTEAAGTPVEAPAARFTQAMQASLQVDELLVDWTADYWTSHANGGCSGSVAAPKSVFANWESLNSQASSAKADVADMVNPLARSAGLRSDWTKETI